MDDVRLQWPKYPIPPPTLLALVARPCRLRAYHSTAVHTLESRVAQTKLQRLAQQGDGHNGEKPSCC